MPDEAAPLWLSCRLGIEEDLCGKACLTEQLPRWFGCWLDVLISVQHPCQTSRLHARETQHELSLSQALAYRQAKWLTTLVGWVKFLGRKLPAGQNCP